MEVTTVSPSPASPAEGDNLCEINVTNMSTYLVTLLICLCGLAGNGAVIGLLNLESGHHDIFKLAVVDFLFLLLTLPSTVIFLLEDMSCSPMMPLMYLNFLSQLSVVSYYWALFWLMPSSPVVYTDKLCNICCRCHLPLRLRLVVAGVQSWAFLAVFTVIPTVTFLCQSQEQQYCQAAFISMYTIILLLLAAPVVISGTIDVIKAKWGSQQQPKRRDIVFFLIVLFTLLLSILNFLQQLGYHIVSSEVFFLLTCIHSSIKPFLYFLVGSWKRDCSMGSCRRHSSMQSLRKAIHRMFEELKENTACSNDPSMDTKA